MNPQRPRIINEESDRKQFSEVLPIAQCVRGSVVMVVRDDDTLCPYRFSVLQARELEALEHAYEAESTAGICIDLMAEGSRVELGYVVTSGLDAKDHHVGDLMALAAEKGVGPWVCATDPLEPEGCIVDGMAAVIGEGDGELVVPVACRGGRAVWELPAHDEPIRVRIYLPYWMGVGITGFTSDGAYEPSAPRDWMLVLGDSISQGLFTGSPALTWAAQASRKLGYDLVNQAVSGHVFDVRTLTGMKRLLQNPPAAVTVAYGTNDWCKRDDWDGIVTDAHDYLARIASIFDAHRVWLISPLWRMDEDVASGCGHELSELRDVLKGYAELFGFNFIDGTTLLPARADQFADERLHPDAVAMGKIADVVAARIASGE
jgi:lysophospholipase L1-like esterase